MQVISVCKHIPDKMSLGMKCFVLLYIALSPVPIAANLSMPLKSPHISAKRGFTARLVHRSSPNSPFYDPHKTVDQIVAENHKIADARHIIMNTTSNIDFRRKPASLDFALVYNIGTPAFETVGVPDTGSSLIWLQCTICKKCYDQDIPLFNPLMSTTYAPIVCDDPVCNDDYHFTCREKTNLCVCNIDYIQGPSTIGSLARDTFILREGQSVVRHQNVIFGCGVENEDPFGFRLPGVVGLGNDSFSLVNQIQGPKRFSFCQSQDLHYDSIIQFGEDAQLLGQSTPLESNPVGYYHLTLDGIDVNTMPVNVSGFYFLMRNNVRYTTGFILDSGATYSYLMPQVFDKLLVTVQSFFKTPRFDSQNWELCYGKTQNRYEQLPELTFKFRDSPMRLSVHNAWFIDGSGHYCLAFKRAKGAFSIFGMYQLKGFNIGFDLDTKKLWMSKEEICTEW